MEGEKKGPDGERGRQWGVGGMEGPDGGKRGEREWAGGGETRAGGGPKLCVCLLRGEGATEVRLSDGSREQVRTLPQTLTLLKAFDQ